MVNLDLQHESLKQISSLNGSELSYVPYGCVCLPFAVECESVALLKIVVYQSQELCGTNERQLQFGTNQRDNS